MSNLTPRRMGSAMEQSQINLFESFETTNIDTQRRSRGVSNTFSDLLITEGKDGISDFDTEIIGIYKDPHSIAAYIAKNGLVQKNLETGDYQYQSYTMLGRKIYVGGGWQSKDLNVIVVTTTYQLDTGDKVIEVIRVYPDLNTSNSVRDLRYIIEKYADI